MRKLLPTLVIAAFVAPHAAEAAPADKNKAQCIAAYEQGQKLKHDGKLKDARKQFLVCMQDTCPALFRKDCDQWLNEVDQTMPSVVFAAKGPKKEDLAEVTVYIDGEKVLDALDGKAIQLDPGNHIIKYEHGDLPPIEQSVLIRVGEKNRALTASFAKPKGDGEAPDQPGGSRPVPAMTWVLGGLGLVALGSFSYFGLTGKSDADKLQDCKPYCAEADVDSARQKLLIADVSLGVGLVSLGAATYLFLTRPSASEEAPTTGFRWQLAPLPGGGFAGVSTRF